MKEDYGRRSEPLWQLVCIRLTLSVLKVLVLWKCLLPRINPRRQLLLLGKGKLMSLLRLIDHGINLGNVHGTRIRLRVLRNPGRNKIQRIRIRGHVLNAGSRGI